MVPDPGFMKVDRLRVGSLNNFSFITSTARAEDAQGTPTQSRISPSILVYEDDRTHGTVIARQLSYEFSTNKTVKARFWPWLSYEYCRRSMLFPSRSKGHQPRPESGRDCFICAIFDRQPLPRVGGSAPMCKKR